MTGGSLTIHGDVGMHLGAHMKGGKIETFGNAGDWVGAEMTGGEIWVHGTAGQQVGAAYRGSLLGMRGGLIMIDFIDMDNMDHRRRVERELKAHLARDKARLNVMQISPLGIVEMTRQRVRQSLRKTFFEPCSCCAGTGHVKSMESVGLEVLREITVILGSLATVWLVIDRSTQ